MSPVRYADRFFAIQTWRRRRAAEAREVESVVKPKIWSRMGRWFGRSGANGTPAGLDSMGQALDVAEHDGPSPGAEIASIPVTGSTGSAGLLARSLRRSRPANRLAGPGVEKLEAQFSRVASLMDAIERHMDVQANRTERIAGSLESLARCMTGAPETLRHQSELLADIRETVAAEQTRTGRIEESLAQWPRVADAQRETMVSISRQLDDAMRVNAATTTVVEDCRQAFSRVEETAGASTRAIERYAGESLAGSERMARLLEEQTARFQVFAWAAIGLGGAAALIAVLSLLR